MWGQIGDAIGNFRDSLTQWAQEDVYRQSMYQRLGPDWQQKVQEQQRQAEFEREEMDHKREEMAFSDRMRPLLAQEADYKLERDRMSTEKMTAESRERKSQEDGVVRSVGQQSMGNSDPLSQIIQTQSISPDKINEMGGQDSRTDDEWRQQQVDLSKEYTAKTGADQDFMKQKRDEIGARLGMAKDSADLQHIESGGAQKDRDSDLRKGAMAEEKAGVDLKRAKLSLQEEEAAAGSPKWRKMIEPKAQFDSYSDIGKSVFDAEFQESINLVEMQKQEALRAFRGGPNTYGGVPQGVGNMQQWDALGQEGQQGAQRLANPQVAQQIEQEIIKKHDTLIHGAMEESLNVFQSRVKETFNRLNPGLWESAMKGDMLDEEEKGFILAMVDALGDQGISAVNADPEIRKLLQALTKKR